MPCIMPRPREPEALRSEVQREICSQTRSRSYFPRVWADVKPANWLINKKYLTSVKGEDIFSASDEALKFYDEAGEHIARRTNFHVGSTRLNVEFDLRESQVR